MQNLKNLSLTAIAACAALVTGTAQANPLLMFGSAVYGTVPYAAAPTAGYNCANGVCQPMTYGYNAQQAVPTGYCTGPNCNAARTVPYSYYVTPTYAPINTSSCPGGKCGQPVYGYGYAYPAGVSYYGSPVSNAVSPAAPAYSAPVSPQPTVSSPAVPNPQKTGTNGPALPATNSGANTASPFYP